MFAQRFRSWRLCHLARICAVLPFLFPPPLRAAAPLPSYFLRTWQTREGLPHNAVTAIVQTRDGYLWLGTYDGLARFDGANFTVFDSDRNPELRSSRVTALFEDDTGRLWIGHETGEVTCYRDGQFEAVEVTPAWQGRKVWNIQADAKGKIWLLSDEGRMAGLRGEVIAAPNAATSIIVAGTARNRHGHLWLLYGGMVFTLERDQLVPLATDNQSLGGYVTGISAGREDGLWIISSGRVRKWSNGGWVDDAGPSPWELSSITAAIELQSGGLAVGTLEKGLYLLFPHRGVLHFNRENGLPHDWVRSLHEDTEGTLWAGTGSGGLVALRAGKVATVNAPDRWQGSVVLSVTAAQDGALWIGTEGAGLYRLHQGEWSHFGEINGLSNQFVWSVSEDRQGRLWAGTWGGGLFVQQGDHFEPLPGLVEGLIPVTAMLHARNEAVWLGTTAGLVHHAAGVTTGYGRKEGLAFPDVRCVVEDQEGGVWFGTLGGGLGRLHRGAAHQFRKADGLTSDYVQCLRLDDDDGALWIGTYGGGLNRLKQGRFASVRTAQGLPNNFICDIEDDGRGHFWISSHGGIFRIEKRELNRCADGQSPAVSCISYGLGDGMPTLECSGGLQPAGCRTADGRLWFPTSKGLAVVDPGDVKTNQLPPPVLIEKLLVDGQPVSLSTNRAAPTLIPPGRKRYEFRYTGLSFVAPEKVRFRYQLEGDWVEGGAERVVIYNSLPPGDYTFRVIACNSDGVWNTAGASVAFRVQPRFWQSWWFRLTAGLTAAAAIAGGVWLIARRRMHLKLERIERQRAIERERARIAQDIHDNLGASLTRITMLSQPGISDQDHPPATGQLDRIYHTARDLTRALDEIVWAINPQHDTLDSLADYLGKYALDYLGPLRVRCRLDMPVQLPAWPLTAEVRHNLFLAFNEALNNVVKHAGASEVSVGLTTGSDAFALNVRDDGKGFVLAATPPDGAGRKERPGRGNGLKNMRRRLEKIGGHCDIQSTPGKGTEVKFDVKVTAHHV